MKKVSMFLKKGSMLLIAFAIVALCLPVGVSAAPVDDWNISGSVQFQTFRYKKNDEAKANTAYNTGDPYNRTQWDLNRYTSRLNMSATSGDITGVFEVRPLGEWDGDSVTPDPSWLRLMYAKWNFGLGSLLIGQAWTPLNQFYSNQVAEDWSSMGAYGAVWEFRKPMIQVQIAGLKVALLKPNTFAPYDFWALGYAAGDIHADYPKVEVGYTQGFGPIVFDLAGAYNTYIVEEEYTLKDIRINSYIAQGGVTANLGPLKASVSGYYGQNTGVIGIGEYYGYSKPVIDADGKKVINAISYGYMGVVSYTVIPTITLEAGIGQAVSEVKDNSSVLYDNVGDSYQKWTVTAFYLQSKITLAKNVYFTPEVGMMDFGDGRKKTNPATAAWIGGGATWAETKVGNKKYIGAQWQMDF
jgi:hypothetical protein